MEIGGKMKKRLIYVDQPQKKVRTIASENELFLAMDPASEFITTMSFMAMNLSWCLFVCTSWASTCNFGNPYYMLFEYSNFFHFCNAWVCHIFVE